MNDASRSQSALDAAAARLAKADRVLALCGAGLSAEAGIPVFRGAGGLWRSHRPEELATPEAFDRDPALVWSWYRWRLEAVLAATPHAGHAALAELGRRLDLTVLNQNVDGLLEQAVAAAGGDRRARVLALHGTIREARCEACGGRRDAAGLPSDAVPRCECGARLRPAVVWFGEALDGGLLDEGDRALAQADLVLSIGTSALVWPAAGVLPAARAQGTPVIEINPDETAFSLRAESRIALPASLALPRLLERAWEDRA